MHAKKTNKTKVLAVVLALVLLVGGAIGGTLAWLTDTSAVVENTFTYGNIDIDLTETTGTEYKIIPGTTEDKDPKVTVVAKSEDCWVLLQVKEENNIANEATNLKYVEWAIAEGWTPLAGVEGVYYRTDNYTTADTATDYQVLAGNKVTYNENLTKQQLEAIGTNGTPKLTFKAFAIQVEAADDAGEAWDLVPTTDRLA